MKKKTDDVINRQDAKAAKKAGSEVEIRGQLSDKTSFEVR
jgi:hypothetical protein